MPRVKFTDRFDAKLLNFCAKKAKSTDISYRVTDFLENAPFRLHNENELLQVAEHLIHLLSKIHENRDFLFETKIRMLFATSQPIPNGQNYLEKVKNFADELEIDVHQTIIYYKRGELELTADAELVNAHDTNLNLLSFVLGKLDNVEAPMSEDAIFSDFSEFLWVNKKTQNRFHQITPVIHQFDHLDMDTKLRLLFLLNIPVAKDFLKQIQSTVDFMELDADFRILKYRNRHVALTNFMMDSELEFTSEVEVSSVD